MFGPFSRYVRPYRSRMAWGVAAILLSQAASALIPYEIGAAVDTLESSVAADALDAIRRHVLVILGLSLVVAVGGFVMRRVLGVASTWIEYDIRTAYFSHLLLQPLSFYQARRTGDLMARATNDLNQVRLFFTYGLRGIVETSLIFVLSILMMMRIDWQLTLLVLIPVPLMSLLVIRLASQLQWRFKAIQDFFGDMSNFVQENLAGIRVVKAFSQGAARTRAFDGLNREYLQRNERLIQTRAVYRPMSFLIASLGLGMNLWLGGSAVIAGTLSMGDFVAFNAYLTLLIRPITYMGWVIDRLQRALVAIRRIDEVLSVAPAIRDLPAPAGAQAPDDGAPPAVTRGELRFRGVAFAYDGVPAVQGIDLTIPAGSTLGIVGRVGSGKTTLARLIPRLIEPTEGEILLDGVPLDRWPLQQLREGIGYVAQMPFLFSDTVRENIAYGLADDEGVSQGSGDDLRRSGAAGDGPAEHIAYGLAVDEGVSQGSRDDLRGSGVGRGRAIDDAVVERVRAAAEEAQVRADVEDFDDGFATVVGERGVTLSGGQKQRTTLARALLLRPRILILDDALSAVDTHTEEAILGHLRGIMAGRTTILIAHRISTLRDADRIVVLDDGRIVEQGTHEQLLALGGFYAELARRQQLAAELERM